LGKECNKQPLQLLYPLFENDYPYSPFKWWCVSIMHLYDAFSRWQASSLHFMLCVPTTWNKPPLNRGTVAIPFLRFSLERRYPLYPY
jgi:hypothetical protein